MAQLHRVRRQRDRRDGDAAATRSHRGDARLARVAQSPERTRQGAGSDLSALELEAVDMRDSIIAPDRALGFDMRGARSERSNAPVSSPTRGHTAILPRHT